MESVAVTTVALSSSARGGNIHRQSWAILEQLLSKL